MTMKLESGIESRRKIENLHKLNEDSLTIDPDQVLFELYGCMISSGRIRSIAHAYTAQDVAEERGERR